VPYKPGFHLSQKTQEKGCLARNSFFPISSRKEGGGEGVSGALANLLGSEGGGQIGHRACWNSIFSEEGKEKGESTRNPGSPGSEPFARGGWLGIATCILGVKKRKVHCDRLAVSPLGWQRSWKGDAYLRRIARGRKGKKKGRSCLAGLARSGFQKKNRGIWLAKKKGGGGEQPAFPSSTATMSLGVKREKRAAGSLLKRREKVLRSKLFLLIRSSRKGKEDSDPSIPLTLLDYVRRRGKKEKGEEWFTRLTAFFACSLGKAPSVSPSPLSGRERGKEELLFFCPQSRTQGKGGGFEERSCYRSPCSSSSREERGKKKERPMPLENRFLIIRAITAVDRRRPRSERSGNSDDFMLI